MQAQEFVRGDVWHYLWMMFIMQMELVLPGRHENLMTLPASDKSSGVTSLGFCNCAWQVLPGPSTAAAALKSCWTLSEQESRIPLSASSLSSYCTFPTLKIQSLSYHFTCTLDLIVPLHLPYTSSASQGAQITALVVGSCSEWLWLRQQREGYTGNICNLISPLLLPMHAKPTKKIKVLLLHTKCCWTHAVDGKFLVN